jgi:hypothetical protein
VCIFGIKALSISLTILVRPGLRLIYASAAIGSVDELHIRTLFFAPLVPEAR